VELDYVDADYLDDYAHFYAKSFSPISNRCRRLHFFTNQFDEAAFHGFVTGRTASTEFGDGYAGFVVARPLPAAVIGRTVLATYPSDRGRRNYPTVRPYSVNLFGVPLKINSLAFQVQDTSLAACATVALWSCFQKTQHLFGSSSPTPVAITRSANAYFLLARPFPSRGLQVQQICNAVVAVGLDPEVYFVNQTLPLASLIYSYLRLGLPVLAVVSIPDVGLHAITLTGYSLRNDQQLSSEAGSVSTIVPKLIGTRIDEFYGHDDQKGPFRRVRLKSPTAPDSVLAFSDTGWSADLKPEAIIVPVYPKIRTGFRDVLKHVMAVSNVAAWTAKAIDFEWDIFLTSGNDFKTSIRSEESQIPGALRERLLLEGLPKYLWRCILRVKGNLHMEMLLDTTEMVGGFPILHIWWHDEPSMKMASVVLSNTVFEKTLLTGLEPRLLAKLRAAII
jgi:hypothetical protein